MLGVQIAENGIEDADLAEEMVKVAQNIELYKEIVRDPVSFIQGVIAVMEEEGIVIEDGEDRTQALVTKALASRYLTREEEQLWQEKQAREENENEAIESDKQWGNLQVLAALILALVFLIITFKVVKPGDDEGEM